MTARRHHGSVTGPSYGRPMPVRSRCDRGTRGATTVRCRRRGEMRKLLAGTTAAIVSTAALAAGSQAASGVATGDTCVANGTGSAYTLTISLTSGAPQQDGFAVGVKGGTVTRVTIGGIPGKASTSGLPAGTDRAWLYGSPQGVPGAS